MKVYLGINFQRNHSRRQASSKAKTNIYTELLQWHGTPFQELLHSNQWEDLYSCPFIYTCISLPAGVTTHLQFMPGYFMFSLISRKSWEKKSLMFRKEKHWNCIVYTTTWRALFSFLKYLNEEKSPNKWIKAFYCLCTCLFSLPFVPCLYQEQYTQKWIYSYMKKKKCILSIVVAIACTWNQTFLLQDRLTVCTEDYWIAFVQQKA